MLLPALNLIHTLSAHAGPPSLVSMYSRKLLMVSVSHKLVDTARMGILFVRHPEFQDSNFIEIVSLTHVVKEIRPNHQVLRVRKLGVVLQLAKVTGWVAA